MNTPTYAYKLSVVIVNYNVQFFLEQCLNSVRIAAQKVPTEVFVVDNISVDESVNMVREKFPEVKLIANQENVGFSKANNQAIRQAKGEYVLLLNPDTVVEEDCFKKVVDFMDQHPDAGGLGVKMVDGKGCFLPESKRALPSPSVAFWKIFGFSNLFPKSKIFGRYHLGHLDKDQTHEVEILSGAFMLMRNETLTKVGLLDENFFMYGEDIDLSYRIILGGYKNYYFSGTSIIHYKGESTKKSSVNYVLVFYKAMVIFAQKHFSQKNAKTFSLLINLAIYLRAGAAIASRFIKKLFLPAIDAACILTGMLFLTSEWEAANIVFPKFVYSISVPIYAFTWLTAAYIQGLYDREIQAKNILFGLAQGTLLILIIYGLLPKDLQFSRLFIFISLAWIISYLSLSRLALYLFAPKYLHLKGKSTKKFVVIGLDEEFERVKVLLKNTFQRVESIQHLHFESQNAIEFDKIRNRLVELVQLKKINEIIFCAKDLSSQDIIQFMSLLPGDGVDYKIARPDTHFLIGRNSFNPPGDLYFIEANNIEEPKNKRLKRIFDVSFASLCLILCPVLVWFYPNKKVLMGNLIGVLTNQLSMVGFIKKKPELGRKLPSMKVGILSPADLYASEMDVQDKLNVLYARDYSLLMDWKILAKAWKKLDRKVR
ncbi:MAG: glycosyltransferase family 2 protein [Crocinitomicaceae bacterium]|nr:glycosyltransferase family 2 protein [Crocinitomicaceae bacterium]